LRHDGGGESGQAGKPEGEGEFHMMTHKERILKVMRGELADNIPFVPRLDLWWLANATGGTLPAQFTGMMPDDISKKYGWATYHMVPNFADISGPDDILHRSIGLFNFTQSVFRWKFSDDVEVDVEERDGQQVVTYHTPLGSVRTVGGLNEAMKKAGSSLGWVQEHAVKNPEDYRVIGYIFENIEVYPQYEAGKEYIDKVGESGVAAVGGPSLGGSPMHLIQKELMDPTKFFYEYKDNFRQVKTLSEKIGVYYDKVLKVVADSPAEVVLWGGNYDDMLTYPPYFEKEILPWLKKASDRLKTKGKIVATHTDGENYGLMELIKNCGVDVAESVTPYPMTKVKIGEYYSRWRNTLTIMGGIPECILLEETASDADFEAYLDDLFKAIVPGDRIILGTADSTPPRAKFERLIRIGERVEKEGRLPLQAGAYNPVSKDRIEKAATGPVSRKSVPEKFIAVKKEVMDGNETALKQIVKELLDEGTGAQDILNLGMISAMEEIGGKFKTGDVFIPEVLLSARAMNATLEMLEPYLSGQSREQEKKVLIGTVCGDMHDIGKNMVMIMLRGVGFDVKDAGINVSADEFARLVEEYHPDILALSALLTTTMSEMENVINFLKEKGLRDKVKIMVGGAPVNRKFAEHIGADGYAPNAGEAIPLAKRLMGSTPFPKFV
jgi:methylmalonyl-CoA mutase cobalamin-binding domain/chain